MNCIQISGLWFGLAVYDDSHYFLCPHYYVYSLVLQLSQRHVAGMELLEK